MDSFTDYNEHDFSFTVDTDPEFKSWGSEIEFGEGIGVRQFTSEQSDHKSQQSFKNNSSIKTSSDKVIPERSVTLREKRLEVIEEQDEDEYDTNSIHAPLQYTTTKLHAYEPEVKCLEEKSSSVLSFQMNLNKLDEMDQNIVISDWEEYENPDPLINNSPSLSTDHHHQQETFIRKWHSLSQTSIESFGSFENNSEHNLTFPYCIINSTFKQQDEDIDVVEFMTFDNGYFRNQLTDKTKQQDKLSNILKMKDDLVGTSAHTFSRMQFSEPNSTNYHECDKSENQSFRQMAMKLAKSTGENRFAEICDEGFTMSGDYNEKFHNLGYVTSSLERDRSDSNSVVVSRIVNDQNEGNVRKFWRKVFCSGIPSQNELMTISDRSTDSDDENAKCNKMIVFAEHTHHLQQGTNNQPSKSYNVKQNDFINASLDNADVRVSNVVSINAEELPQNQNFDIVRSVHELYVSELRKAEEPSSLFPSSKGDYSQQEHQETNEISNPLFRHSSTSSLAIDLKLIKLEISTKYYKESNQVLRYLKNSKPASDHPSDGSFSENEETEIIEIVSDAECNYNSEIRGEKAGTSERDNCIFQFSSFNNCHIKRNESPDKETNPALSHKYSVICLEEGDKEFSTSFINEPGSKMQGLKANIDALGTNFMKSIYCNHQNSRVKNYGRNNKFQDNKVKEKDFGRSTSRKWKNLTSLQLPLTEEDNIKDSELFEKFKETYYKTSHCINEKITDDSYFIIPETENSFQGLYIDVSSEEQVHKNQSISDHQQEPHPSIFTRIKHFFVFHKNVFSVFTRMFRSIQKRRNVRHTPHLIEESCSLAPAFSSTFTEKSVSVFSRCYPASAISQNFIASKRESNLRRKAILSLKLQDGIEMKYLDCSGGKRFLEKRERNENLTKVSHCLKKEQEMHLWNTRKGSKEKTGKSIHNKERNECPYKKIGHHSHPPRCHFHTCLYSHQLSRSYSRDYPILEHLKGLSPLKIYQKFNRYSNGNKAMLGNRTKLK